MTEKINILVVDDLPEKLLVLETILRSWGRNVITARSGEEALRRLMDAEFAVILLDVNMPPGMSGLETAAMIRRRKKTAHTPIIFITAFADEMHTAQGYSLGAVDYILSPIVPEILRTKVSVFVELFRMTQQARHQADERVALAREQAARQAAEEATRRSAFLAEASTVLTNSLDFDATVRGLLQLTVPFLGDLAAVTLAGEAGHPWRSELAYLLPPDGLVHHCTVTAAEGPQDELRAAVERVLATGRPETLAGLAVAYPPAVGQASSLSGQRQARSLSHEYGMLHTAIVLPLLARGRILGR